MMVLRDLQYLRSRKRRGRWFHTYRRDGREMSLAVHGLEPQDPRVIAAWSREHERWESAAPNEETKRPGSLSWAIELYKASPHWSTLAAGTKKSRSAIFANYVNEAGDRPVSDIWAEDLEATLIQIGGNAAINQLKALKPVFAYLKQLRFISSDPAAGIKLAKPKSDGFPTASAEEIQAFQEKWPRGTTERLIFDLALYTGAARADLVKLGRKHIKGELLEFKRVKTGVLAQIPITRELARVISELPDIAPAFILTSQNQPYSSASLGNLFGDAAKAAGMAARLHGLRKAFCVYWAERGASTHQIMAMAGHATLAEVERYTRATDRTKLVRLLVEES